MGAADSWTSLTTRGWFRQDRPILQRVISWSRLRTPEDVVQELMALFREVEEFWDTGRVGQHIRLLPNLFQSGQELQGN